MTQSLLGWIAAAVLLFWSVGAYNRLVRLRADIHAAFGDVDAQLQQEVRLVESVVQEAMPPDLPESTGSPDALTPGPSQSQRRPSFWDALRGAAVQLSATLSAARARPLERRRIEALSAASGVLRMAWERVEREDAHDLAGPRLPETLSATRLQQLAQAQAAIDRYNQATARYNDAVAQFPAAVLAWVFGFKPARPL